MLRVAFKEWAAICRALGAGRQALILRKGGIAEPGPTFEPEHTRFWLFPTYVHQQRSGLRPEAAPFLEAAEAERPPAGVLRLSHFAEVGGVYQVRDLPTALQLADLHLWSEETVKARFAYRRPGLFVLPVRVYAVPKVLEVRDAATYTGCKSWVELEQELPTAGARPVLDDAAFQEVLRRLELTLKPTTLT